RGADRCAHAAGNARRRPDLARHHDGGEFADLVYASPAGPDFVLSARRCTASDHDAAYLRRHHSVCAHTVIRAGGALVRPWSCIRIAPSALRALESEAL